MIFAIFSTIMKALILIGGLGTRLRPFTLKAPKPLMPVANVPFIHHQILQMKAAGVREVILAMGYKAAMFRRALGDGKRFGVKLRLVEEKTPLGTGGGVGNAARFLSGTSIIMNGDNLHDLDIRRFLANHRKQKGVVSIALTRVEDPTQFGLVETDKKGRIKRFLEKPSPNQITCDTINSGAYIFEPEAWDLIPSGVSSLERDLFPKLLETGRRMLGFISNRYWIDIGTREKYHQVHMDLLNKHANFSSIPKGRKGSVLVDKTARISKSSVIDGAVCIGPRATVGPEAHLKNCVILAGARIGARASISDCVVGPRSRVGNDAVVSAGAALGEGTILSEYTRA